MPLRTRMYLPGYPYHVVQRGNNRQACFIQSADYQVYIDLWQQCSNRYQIEVHDNHPPAVKKFCDQLEQKHSIKFVCINRGRPRK